MYGYINQHKINGKGERFMQRILLATGNDTVDKVIETKVAPAVNAKVIGAVSYKKDLRKYLVKVEGLQVLL